MLHVAHGTYRFYTQATYSLHDWSCIATRSRLFHKKVFAMMKKVKQYNKSAYSILNEETLKQRQNQLICQSAEKFILYNVLLSSSNAHVLHNASHHMINQNKSPPLCVWMNVSNFYLHKAKRSALRMYAFLLSNMNYRGSWSTFCVSRCLSITCTLGWLCCLFEFEVTNIGCCVFICLARRYKYVVRSQWSS